MGLLDSLFGSKAKSLYKQGMALAKKHDFEGAIAVYTTLIETKNAPEDLKAMAMMNRALGHSSMNNYIDANKDLQAIVKNPKAPANVKAMAEQKMLRYKKLSARNASTSD